MLAVAITDIQSLYESQPLLTQVDGFPQLSTDTDSADEDETNDDSAG